MSNCSVEFIDWSEYPNGSMKTTCCSMVVGDNVRCPMCGAEITPSSYEDRLNQSRKKWKMQKAQYEYER